jgi:activator of 2-hydroxyglutaryl-CoA dehydratase
MIGIENQVVFVGGLARNTGLVESLRKNIGVELLVPESPEYIGALGAALTVANEIAGK